MLIIDKFAYTNNLKDLSPKKKFGYSMGLLLASLINKEPLIFIAIIAFAFAGTVFWAKIPLGKYLKMLTVPFAFLFTSILAIVFSFSQDEAVFIWSVNLKVFYVGVTELGLNNALILFLRAMSALGCLYFLTLTTPMDQQLYIMRKLRLPAYFLDLYALTYRFIFILLDESIEIYRAQELRFGYNNLKNSYSSLSILIRVLFERVMNRYQDMEIALDSKLYTGDFHMEKQEDQDA